MNCPTCREPMLPGSSVCYLCGKGAPESKREAIKTCPGCKQPIPLYFCYHQCGWLSESERLIRDAMENSPAEAVKRYRNVSLNPQARIDYECEDVPQKRNV